MLRVIVLVCSLFAFAPRATAAEPDWGAIAEETFRVTLPGPRPDETRQVYYWRPANAEGALPTLFLADGLAALKLAVAELRPAIVAGRARPVLVVAIQPSQQPLRYKEYFPGDIGENPEWRAHYAWFVHQVLPWAEHNIGATPRASERGIGGVSNGADFAIAVVSRRPDLFSAVLAHSPVNEVTADIRDSEAIRWVLTVGSEEFEGRAEPLQERIVSHIDPDAPLRRCVGPWDHDEQSWGALMPGSIAWMLQLSDSGAVDTATERRHCTTEHRA